MFRCAVLLLGLTGCNLVFGVDVPGDGGDDVVVDGPPSADALPPLEGAMRITIDDDGLGLTDIRECTPNGNQRFLVFTAIKGGDNRRRVYVATDGETTEWKDVEELTRSGDFQTSAPRFDSDGSINLAFSNMGAGNRRVMVYLQGNLGALTWNPIARNTFAAALPEFDFGMGGMVETGTGNPLLIVDSAGSADDTDRRLREFGDGPNGIFWDEVNSSSSLQAINDLGGGRNPYLTNERRTIYFAGNGANDDAIFEAARPVTTDAFAAPVIKFRIAAGRVSQPYFENSHYYFTVEDAGAASGCYYY